MYRAGKLASRPKSLSLYISRPLTRSPEFDLLMQENETPQFELGVLEFVIYQHGPCLVEVYPIESGMTEKKLF